MNELKKEDLRSDLSSLTVGRLKKFIEEHNLSDDSLVLIERVEDVYYENHGWRVYLKDSDYSNEVAESPDATPEKINEARTQYHPAFCCARYKDDPDILFINLHF